RQGRTGRDPARRRRRAGRRRRARAAGAESTARTRWCPGAGARARAQRRGPRARHRPAAAACDRARRVAPSSRRGVAGSRPQRELLGVAVGCTGRARRREPDMTMSAYFRSAGKVHESAFARYSDLVLVFGIVAIVAMMVLPLPAWLIDFLVAVNIATGLGLL